ncbi:MAG: hypothetical protein H5T97_06570, partial [Firmicutes bacterium]|nr:hypothetical protein [Bacillota bacterium]
MLSAGGRRPGRPRFRPVTAPNPYRNFPGHNSLRALWVLPVIAGAVLALLVALLTARVGYAGTVLTGVFCSREWTPADEPLAAGADLGYTTKNYVRLAVYSAEPLQSLRVGTLSLPVAVLDKDYSVEGAVYRYPAEGRDAVALLRPGKNTVTVSARGARLTESLKFSVTYVAAPVEDAEYYVADVGAVRQVTAFDKALQFSTPAGTVILDGTVPAADQSMRWVVYDPPSSYYSVQNKYYVIQRGFRPVSKVFGLEFARTGYKLSAEPTLILKYDTNVSPTTAAQMLTVFVSDHPEDFGDNAKVQNLGGVVDTRNGTITVKLDKDCGGRYYGVFLGVQNFEEFLNAPNDEVLWSYAYVMPLWAKGIMEAVQDNSNVWNYTVPGGGYFGLVDKDPVLYPDF